MRAVRRRAMRKSAAIDPRADGAMSSAIEDIVITICRRDKITMTSQIRSRWFARDHDTLLMNHHTSSTTCRYTFDLTSRRCRSSISTPERCFTRYAARYAASARAMPISARFIVDARQPYAPRVLMRHDMLVRYLDAVREIRCASAPARERGARARRARDRFFAFLVVMPLLFCAIVGAKDVWLLLFTLLSRFTRQIITSTPTTSPAHNFSPLWR